MIELLAHFPLSFALYLWPFGRSLRCYYPGAAKLDLHVIVNTHTERPLTLAQCERLQGRQALSAPAEILCGARLLFYLLLSSSSPLISPRINTSSLRRAPIDSPVT